MINNRGQALVEFIMVFPILMIILMAIVDFGNIFLNHYRLENTLEKVESLYLDNKIDDINAMITKDNITLDITKEGEYTKLTLTKSLKINTPGLNLIIGNPYKVLASQFIYNNNEEPDEQ